MTAWNDYNSADDQNSFDLIPKGTLVKVRMTIKPGGHDDPAQGWTGGYATQNQTTGSVYLNCEFVVLDDPYARRKMWSLIGLHSPKGPEWANMGRAFIKGILNSARGLHPQDNSPRPSRPGASTASPISMASSSSARWRWRRTSTARTRTSSRWPSRRSARNTPG